MINYLNTLKATVSVVAVVITLNAGAAIASVSSDATRDSSYPTKVCALIESCGNAETMSANFRFSHNKLYHGKLPSDVQSNNELFVNLAIEGRQDMAARLLDPRNGLPKITHEVFVHGLRMAIYHHKQGMVGYLLDIMDQRVPTAQTDVNGLFEGAAIDGLSLEDERRAMTQFFLDRYINMTPGQLNVNKEGIEHAYCLAKIWMSRIPHLRSSLEQLAPYVREKLLQDGNTDGYRAGSTPYSIER